MRGEHHQPPPQGGPQRGSSPHARGTRDVGDGVSVAAGIIPACAGNTRIRRGIRPHWRDHPRMRGEHSIRPLPIVAWTGSSPHARGTRMWGSGDMMTNGIIPACAGNTRLRSSPDPPPWDHPRMRGEHHWYPATTDDRTGSSPHARGTLVLTVLPLLQHGIIPACAGNTAITNDGTATFRDHPRMRGEHP